MGKAAASQTSRLTYFELGEKLKSLGFIERPTKGEHHLLQFEEEPKWFFLFPGGDKWQKPVESYEWPSIRAHLDLWGILEAATVEQLQEKLQELG